MDDDNLDQIDRLFALKEKGVLSEDEFQAEKSRIWRDVGDEALSSPDFSPQEEIPASDTAHQTASDTIEGGQEIDGHQSHFRSRSRTPIIVGVVVAVGAIAGGLIYWREFPVSMGEKPVAVVSNAMTATKAPIPSDSLPELSEVQLLKLAFAATIGKHGTGYTPKKLVPISKDIYAVIATAEGGEAHADAGRLGVQYAKRTGNSFISASPLREVESGSFGEEPAWKMRSDLATIPLVVVEGGGAWQGCTSSIATIVELSPAAPKVLGSVPVSYSYEDEEGILTEYNGEIEQGASGLQVRYVGSVEKTIPLSISGGVLRPQAPLPKGC